MELLGDVGHVESHFFSVWRLLVSVQDRCMVCARCTIGLQIVLEASDGTTRLRGQVEARFSPFGESAILTQDRCTVCVEHIIGSEMILDAPDGIPR